MNTVEADHVSESLQGFHLERRILISVYLNKKKIHSLTQAELKERTHFGDFIVLSGRSHLKKKKKINMTSVRKKYVCVEYRWTQKMCSTI